jgi:hypothetical protein
LLRRNQRSFNGRDEIEVDTQNTVVILHKSYNSLNKTEKRR